MAHLAVTVVLLFLACVHAAPAPANRKFTLAKSSAVGLGVASHKSKAHALSDNRGAANAPENTGNAEEEIVLANNVNAGVGIALSGSLASGILKNNRFTDGSDKGQPNQISNKQRKENIRALLADINAGFAFADNKSIGVGIVANSKFVESPNKPSPLNIPSTGF